MRSRITARLPGACAVVLLGVVLAGCNSGAGTTTTTDETTTTTVAETTTTTVAPTTTTTTVAPTTTLAPSEDPDHPFYDPYEGMDTPEIYSWPVGFGELDEAIDLMMGAAATGGVVPQRGCDTVPVGNPCYTVEDHTHVDGRYHVVVISLRLASDHEDRSGRDHWVEVRSEDPRQGWQVTKETFAHSNYSVRPAWAR